MNWLVDCLKECLGSIVFSGMMVLVLNPPHKYKGIKSWINSFMEE